MVTVSGPSKEGANLTNLLYLPGSPFRVLIDDNTNVFARGDCLDAAPLHQPCSFELDAAKALFVANPRVSIIGEAHTTL